MLGIIKQIENRNGCEMNTGIHSRRDMLALTKDLGPWFLLSLYVKEA